jgi:exodeoxyribonuclease-5
MTTITLTEEQQTAVNLALSNLRAKVPMTRIGGYAGTGKTTLIHAVMQGSPVGLAVCAYTGKAANVLRSKGLPTARTIHSTCYKHQSVEEPDPKKPGKMRVVSRFLPVPLEALRDAGIGGFIIDEASMVGKEVLDDLTAYGLPIIAVGDPGQLPPISKYDVNLMQSPDYVLEKIHRQAADSAIIRLATEIRTKGASSVTSFESTGDVKVVDKYEAKQENSDVVLCGFNRTRAAMNTLLRKRAGRTEPTPMVGEPIIFLANDSHLGVFNGMMGTVAEVRGSTVAMIYPRGEDPLSINVYDLMVRIDGDETPRPFAVSSFGFEGNKVEWGQSAAHFNRYALADYGYAITCHKAQGSQWPKVTVLNEAAPKLWDQKRWLYTAVTRAANNLVVGD